MSQKTRLDIPVILPNVPDTRDACIGRLRDLLEAKEGIDAAHVIEANAKQPDRICIHFDPNRMSLGQVRELARRAGAQLESRYGHIVRKSQPMHARLARSKSERLGQLDGVVEASVSPDGVLRIEFDRERMDEEAVLAAARRFGVELVEEKSRRAPREAVPARPGAEEEGEEHDHGGIFGENSELIFALVCGSFLLTGWLLALANDVASWVP